MFCSVRIFAKRQAGKGAGGRALTGVGLHWIALDVVVRCLESTFDCVEAMYSKYVYYKDGIK